MAYLYAESFDRPIESNDVAEDLYEGDLVTDKGDGLYKTAGADATVSGIVLHNPHGDAMAENEYDYVSDPSQMWQYLASEGDKAHYAGGEDGARVRPATPADNGTDPAPNITHNAVVGVADIAGYEGRVVESGYTDAAATTYDASAGNFVPLGKAKLDHSDDGAVTGFEERVTVVVDKNL